MSEEYEESREEEDEELLLERRGGRERMSCGWAVQLLRGVAFLLMTHEVHSSQPAGIPRRNAARKPPGQQLATMGGSPGNGGLWGLTRA
ncbi:unnamed protein product [Urochloa humidicola]